VLEPFLNYFRRQAAPTEALYRLCYLSAYDALPTALLKDSEKFWETYFLAKQPALAWFTHMCLLTNTKSDPFSAATFRWHKGRLSNGREFMIVQYPEPTPAGLSVAEFDAGKRLEDLHQVLAPYFSAVLRKTTMGPASCFALAQSPVDGITSLRRCTSAAHYSLGRGPEPTLENFLGSLLEVEGKPVKAATVRHPDDLSELDIDLLDSLSEDGFEE
jgi:hypothetical protein